MTTGRKDYFSDEIRRSIQRGYGSGRRSGGVPALLRAFQWPQWASLASAACNLAFVLALVWIAVAR